MYKILSVALLGVLVALIVPAASVETVSNDDRPAFYGYSVMALKDTTGTVVFENTVHNEVLSLGVDFILDQVFNDDGGVVTADVLSVDAICIFVTASPMADLFGAGNETITLVQLNDNLGDQANANDNCIGDIEFTTTGAGADGVASAVSTTANFQANSVHMEDGATVVGIAICQTVGSPANECAAPVFAMIDTADITVNVGETLDISYTMTID